MTTVEERIAISETKVAALETKIDRIEVKIDTIQERLLENSATMPLMKKSLDLIIEKLDKHINDESADVKQVLNKVDTKMKILWSGLGVICVALVGAVVKVIVGI